MTFRWAIYLNKIVENNRTKRAKLYLAPLFSATQIKLIMDALGIHAEEGRI